MKERQIYRDHLIVVEADSDPQNPRTEWDNLGTMLCVHSRYSLGDPNESEGLDSADDILTFMGEQCPGWEALIDKQEKRGEDSTAAYDDHASWDLFAKECKEEKTTLIEKYMIILPLYLYDHSGITMKTSSFSCNWDSGQVGVIYISKKKAVKELGKKYFTKKLEEKICTYLEGEVETYDNYLTGQVYGYTSFKPLSPDSIKSLDLEEDPTDERYDDVRKELHSCWGFYGYEQTLEKGDMMSEIKAEIDSEIERNEQIGINKMVNALTE